jgi:hypothetical protein
LKKFVTNPLSAIVIPIPTEGKKDSDGENKSIFGFKLIDLKE